MTGIRTRRVSAEWGFGAPASDRAGVWGPYERPSRGMGRSPIQK